MENSMLKRLEATKVRLAEVDKELLDENVMRDRKKFRDLNKEHANIEPIVEAYEKYLRLDSDLNDSVLMMGDSDPEISELGHVEHKRLEEEIEKLTADIRIMLLPKDPNDDKNIIVEIRGAAGGDEANIFAGDLFRMYTRYAEKQGWKTEVLNELENLINNLEQKVEEIQQNQGFLKSIHILSTKLSTKMRGYPQAGRNEKKDRLHHYLLYHK